MNNPSLQESTLIHRRNYIRFKFSLLNFQFLVFLVILLHLVGCGKKETVVRERVEDPLISFESFEHGINPKATTIKIYTDGYVLKTSKDDYSGKKESKAIYISTSQVTDLKEFFIQEGFLDAEPVRIPALYGGVVVTITFTSDGKSNTVKFLDGTKIPFSVERCRDKLQNVISLF